MKISLYAKISANKEEMEDLIDSAFVENKEQLKTVLTSMLMQNLSESIDTLGKENVSAKLDIEEVE